MAHKQDSNAAHSQSHNPHNLTPRKDGRWVKWIRGLKTNKYFGRGRDLVEANSHYENFLETGTYIKPAAFAASRPDAPPEPEPAAQPTGFSTMELAKRWASMSGVERQRAKPGPLKNLNVHPRSDAEGWRAYIVPATGGKAIEKKFVADPHRAAAEYNSITSRGKSIRSGDLMEATELAEIFLDRQKERVKKGKLADALLNLYIEDLSYFEAFFRGREVDNILPDEWILFQEKCASTYKNDPNKKLSPRTANDRMARILTMLNWASARNREHIQPPTINDDFFPYSKTEIDDHIVDNEEPWTRDHILAFLKHEREKPVRCAQILLAFNGGYGNKDLAILTETERDFEGRRNKLDLDGGWIDASRPKTKKRRRMKLMPETSEILRRVVVTPQSLIAEHGWGSDEFVRLADVADMLCCTATNLRTRAKRKGMRVDWGRILAYDACRLMLKYRRAESCDPIYDNLIFRTEEGGMFVKTNENENARGQKSRTDNTSQYTDRAIKKIGLPSGLSFYGIRHTFSTVARKFTNDEVLHKHIMGHAMNRIEQAYFERQLIEDSFYENVANGLREWLFGDELAKADVIPDHWQDDVPEADASRLAV